MTKTLCLFILLLSTIYCFAQDGPKDSAAAAQYLADTKRLFGSDRQASLNSALAGLEIADKLRLTGLSANFNNMLGIIYSYQAKYDISLKHLTIALQQATEVKDELLLSKVYTNFGMNYLQQGNQQKSIEASLTGARIATRIGSVATLGNTYANISESFYNLKMYPKAIMYGDTALKYFLQAGNLRGVASVYNTRGVMYSDNKQHDSALLYYTKSLKIKTNSKDIDGQANTLTNIGTTYSDLRQFDKALVSFREARKLYEEVNDPKGLAEVAQNMAALKLAQKDSTAVKDSQKAYDFAKKNTTIEQQRDIAFSLSGMYRDKKDYANSLKYFTIYDSLKDATLNTGVLKQVTELDAKYQTELKQHQIALLNKQNTIQQLELARRNFTLIVIVVVFGLTLLLAFQLYTRNKVKNEAKLQAEVIRQQALASKGIINAEERERKRLAAELHDGVGQLFSTVKMNMEILIEKFIVKHPEADLIAERTMAMVDESCTEVRSIAHQMMPNALIKSGLVSALRDFINKIPAEKLQVSFETEGIDKPLDSTTETVLYRVIQESVNNVIKHAEASSLDIMVLCNSQEITVSIEDNGKGFEVADKMGFTGIGLKNMISRVEYLKGSVDISSAAGKGTLVAIFIPLK